jgi:hypothetical protein
MFEFQHILFGGVIPLALAIVLVIFDVRPWRRGAERSASWSVVLAVGMGFVVGYGFALGWPALPPRNANDWLLWGGIVFVLLGVVDGLLGGARRRGRRAFILRGLLVLAGLGAMSYLQVAPLLKGLWAGGGWAFIIAATVVGWLWWLQADRLAQRLDGRTLLAMWFLVAGAAAQLVMLSGSQSMGQAVGGMIAALFGSLGVLLMLRVTRAPASVIMIVAPIVAGLLVNALAWLDPHPPAWRVGAVLLAPLLPWLVEPTPVRRWGWLSKTLIQLAMVVLPLTAMLASAAMEFAEKNAVGVSPDAYYE